MSWTPTRWHFHAACIAAAIVVFATVYWASRPGQPESPESSPVALPPQASRDDDRHTPVPTPQAAANSTLEGTEVPAVDTEAATVAEYTSEKYQLLLDDLHYLDAGQSEKLRLALVAREQLVGEPGAAGQSDALANVEKQIRGMLNAADHATYQMLRESDLELFKLNEYAGGIANVAPLSAADRKAILRTKLSYKERFRQLLRDSNLERSDLTAAEREYAYSLTSRAMEDYRRSYLQEVRQYLSNDEQYALLSNYETTEFNAELAKLKAMVSGSSQGGS